MSYRSPALAGPSRAFKLTVIAAFSSLSLSLTLGVIAYLQISELPKNSDELAQLMDHSFALSTEIYDRKGQKIGEFAEERRYFVKLSEMPRSLVNAFLSAEDQNFYHHHGISPSAIVRSAFANIRGGRLSQGGSTITQQVARAYYLSREKTLTRKFKEAVLALILERRLSKDQILELYLNKIFLGNRSYGVEAAARNYFRKHVKDLNLGEVALLAALPKGPSYYAPHRHYVRASERQAWVLSRMVADKVISRDEATYWQQQTIWVAKAAQDLSTQAPYFVAAVKDELQKKFEMSSLSLSGMRIFTTLDVNLQKEAKKQIDAALTRIKPGLEHTSKLAVRGMPLVEGALISLDPQTGAVRAMQGGRDFSASQYNRAVSTKRAVGALMMPVYTSLALERGYDLSNLVDFDPLAPQRQSQLAEPVSVYQSVVDGRLFDGARLFTSLGAGSVRQHAERLGLNLSANRTDDILLAVGYGAASPESVAVSFSTFANGGMRVSPYLISRIEDGQGHVVYEQRLNGKEKVLSAQAAFLTTSLLQHVTRFGASRDLFQGVVKAYPEAAGMGGASDDLHNSWYVGMLPDLVTAVWLGAEKGTVRLARDENKVTRLAADLWQQYASRLPPGIAEPEKSFIVPNGISFGRINVSKSPGSPVKRTLPFASKQF